MSLHRRILFYSFIITILEMLKSHNMVSGLGMQMSLCNISPPIAGIGAVLFRPKGLTVKPALGETSSLVKAGRFFTKAFWSSKLTGKDEELSSSQVIALERQQVQEFRRRYSIPQNYAIQDKKSELFICTNAKEELMGCAGIEIDYILKPSEKVFSSSTIKAPLMSNLAVGKAFRRRGVAEKLVENAEQIARKEWGFNECYLFVEKGNAPAVKLYRKLGYKKVWENKDAKTMIPTASGSLKSAPTVIVCMKKRLDLGALGRFLPF